MKKILLINNGYPTKQNPAYTTYIQSIVNCLRQASFDVDVLAIFYNRKISICYKLYKYLFFWKKVLCLNLNDCDIIYINHLPFVWPILFNPTLCREKVYVHWHGDDLVSKSRFIKYTLRLIRRKGYGFKHITPSFYFKRKLIEIMNYSEEEISISPSGGVNTNLFTSPIYNSHDNIIIGYSAALTKFKGADILLEIIKRKSQIERECNKKITFKVINYGSEAEYYVNQIRRLHSGVVIVEKVPKKKMPDFYHSINILVMPSIRESLGLVVLEAMSCNVPVVTFNVCAFPEFVISGESGELVELSSNFQKCVDGYIDSLKKIINSYTAYCPSEIIGRNYSEKSVIEFYKETL